MKTTIRRTFLFLLLFTIITSACSTCIFAQDFSFFNEKEQSLLDKVIAGTVTKEELDDMIDSGTVPEIIGIEKARNRFHTERLYEEEENLNTVIFRNLDGTKRDIPFPFR